MIPEKELLDDLKNQPLEKVLEKYNISLNELFQLQRNRNYHDNKTSNIYHTSSNKYAISKTINGVNYHYGTYADKREAVMVAEALTNCGWDINELPGILERLNIQSKSE